jgi:PAS domain S-box-containing protein
MASEFEAACEALSDVLITVDESFRVLYANPALTRVFGYTAGELVGQPIEWLIPERFHEEHARHARTFADGGERHRVMHRTRLVVGRHKSGAELKLEATVSRASAQGAARFAVVLRDVGEQLALERDFKALEERLQRIARLEALASLSAGIAHDFNNTLTVVLSLTRAVAESLPPESPEAHDLEEVMRAATRSAELTRRLLAFGRQGVRAEEAVDPGVVLHDLVSLARATSPASVHVVARLMPVLPLVRVDESQLAQALLNLVTNALFAMHEVGGMLELSAREQALDAPLLTSTRTLPPGRYLCVTVADTGRGISPDVLPRVFEPFFTTKPAGIGTGLGSRWCTARCTGPAGRSTWRASRSWAPRCRCGCRWSKGPRPRRCGSGWPHRPAPGDSCWWSRTSSPVPRSSGASRCSGTPATAFRCPTTCSRCWRPRAARSTPSCSRPTCLAWAARAGCGACATSPRSCGWCCSVSRAPGCPGPTTRPRAPPCSRARCCPRSSSRPSSPTDFTELANFTGR